MSDSEAARAELLAQLREHALVIGEVTLSSGQTASYYVDAKRALLLPGAFRALGELVAAEARQHEASAVGGLTMGADPIACAALAADDGAALRAFFVRKERKQHGLQRWIEGPMLEPGTRCLVVEDVVTTGGSRPPPRLPPGRSSRSTTSIQSGPPASRRAAAAARPPRAPRPPR